jgi:ABC-2 type transport system ATP-binding protein
MIEVEGLGKTYRVARKAPGLRASLASLFRRTYEDVVAVDALSFTIPSGARVGFLGPNGAGKTTTLKMLSGLLTPSRGQVRVLGLDPRGRPPELLRQITLVMGQKQQLIWDLPPAETFELNRAIYAIDRAEYRRTLDELVTLLDLGDLVHKPTRQLSLGERMKCELAAALLHRPRVLFLDEPTIGLDVSMQAVVRRFVAAYNEATGATVLLTSHDMDDVRALCPRVIVIDRGTLRFDGDLDALARRHAPDRRLRLTLASPLDAAAVTALGARLGVAVVAKGPDVLELQIPPGEVPDLTRRVLAELPVVDLGLEATPLEDVMRTMFDAARTARDAR